MEGVTPCVSPVRSNPGRSSAQRGSGEEEENSRLFLIMTDCDSLRL